MLYYTLSSDAPHKSLLRIQVSIPVEGRKKVNLQFPRWRPGRYELGDFAKNLMYFKVLNAPFENDGNHAWVVNSEGLSELQVEYVYSATELNAGSTFLSEEQLYVNPVNCFVYDKDRQDSPSKITLNIPEDYTLAGGLPQTEKHSMLAKDVQELMDCPFMAAPNIEQWTYTCQNIPFHICLLGEHHLDKEKVMNAFRAFTEAQLKAFGGLPVKEYWFLFQLPAFPVRHGVEHENSTVIALGPGKEVHEGKLYDDFLGISSHELYHTWNIKSIRPKEMMPYDFSKENHSKLGYVAEGVTTYFGDEMLYRSGVISPEEYLRCMENQLERHFWNLGWMNKSVADSSYETWLDGYVRGVPGRKVSIYTEGCLITFMCDQKIKQATQGKSSMDEVMKLMWERFGKLGKGYSEDNYWKCVEEVSGSDFSKIKTALVYGTEDYTPFLAEAFKHAGMEWTEGYLGYFETKLGVRLLPKGGRFLVWDVYPGSPADQAKLWYGDEIVSINHEALGEHWNDGREEGQLEPVSLTVLRHGKEREVQLQPEKNTYFTKHKLAFQQ